MQSSNMKHIVITGSTRGIGYGLAKHFLSAGYAVTISGTTSEHVERAYCSLMQLASGNRIQGFTCDVTNREEIGKLWKKAVANLGPIHIWINNAGIDQNRKLLWELEPEQMDKLMRVNVLGMMHGSVIAFQQMIKQGFGFIYNMEGFGSDGMMMDKLSLYGTSKRAVRYFTRSLAREARNTPVCIGTLSPGMVATDLLRNSLLSDPQTAKANKRIFNILADDTDTVTHFLVKKILANRKNGAHIARLNKAKILWKFARAPFVKRDLFAYPETQS